MHVQLQQFSLFYKNGQIIINAILGYENAMQYKGFAVRIDSL